MIHLSKSLAILLVVHQVFMWRTRAYSSAATEGGGVKRTRPPPPPVILDTDYGSFIDDVFALGLLLQSSNLLDLKLILTTSENSTVSAKCAAAHLSLHGYGSDTTGDIPVVAIGSNLPPQEQRAGVCAAPVGFALTESVCASILISTNNVPPLIIENGIKYTADLILGSDRDDWWYLAVGGQTSLRDFLVAYPDAAAKIDTLIIMGGNWCAGMEPFPGIPAPMGELNIACDPAAANAVLEILSASSTNIYYVPIEVAADHQLKDENYARIQTAAANHNNSGAAAMMEMYKKWSDGARANKELLVHSAALAYDPKFGVPTLFDTLAAMLALDLVNAKKGCTDDDSFAIYDFEAVRFVEVGEDSHSAGSPRGAFSLHVGEMFDSLPEECPALTNYTFDKKEIMLSEKPVKIALGFTSEKGKQRIYREMSSRIAGESILCGNAVNKNEEL